MLTLITGASASGKSEYAESLAVKTGKRLCYIATMRQCGGSDGEFLQRVARHRALRAGKGFVTLECPFSPVDLDASQYDTALLECLSNLVANEVFDGAGAKTETVVLEGIKHLCGQCKNLIVVTNELFSDGVAYDEGTREYMRVLGKINCKLAKMAQRVVEVVYTLPIVYKNEGSKAE
ncbi:MAG: bifunctional adenosylcobinamide kinase/adenosylcobinamide-phosphate guanylyltransferase [Hydrogenoanaerobacterium sp.]